MIYFFFYFAKGGLELKTFALVILLLEGRE